MEPASVPESWTSEPIWLRLDKRNLCVAASLDNTTKYIKILPRTDLPGGESARSRHSSILHYVRVRNTVKTHLSVNMDNACIYMYWYKQLTINYTSNINILIFHIIALSRFAEVKGRNRLISSNALWNIKTIT